MFNGNCVFCGKTIQLVYICSGGDYLNQNRSFAMGTACKECAIEKEKQLSETPMVVVSSCPICGAPIYGLNTMKYGDLPRLSGNPHVPVTHMCNCRYHQKVSSLDVSNIDVKLGELNRKIDSIEKIQIINSGIQQPKWWEIWK